MRTNSSSSRASRDDEGCQEPASRRGNVHAAGRTEEGFRIVGIWESEDAWLRFAEQLRSALGSSAPPEVYRALEPDHVVYGRREEGP